MPYKDKEIVRMFYTIGDVAKMFNSSVSQIRYYENEFDILSPAKNKKGNRLFTPEDVENLKIIFHLIKERGFTLEGARKKLKENKTDLQADLQLRETLLNLKNFLTELKNNL